MSEENQEQGQKAPEKTGDDQFKQLKSEFSRKFDSVSKFQEQTQQTLAQIAKQLQERQQSQSRSEEREDDEDFLDLKPSEYGKKVAEQAKKEALEEFRREQQSRDGYQQTLNQLIQNYPELADGDSDLYKKVEEKTKAYDEASLARPEVIKAVALEAAAEMGVLPMSRRERSGDEDFSLSASSGRSGRSRDKKQRETEEDKEILQIAQLFGVNVDDKEAKDRLINKHKNRNWNSWR